MKKNWEELLPADCSKRIVKSVSVRRKIILKGNLEHQEWRKSSRNGYYLGKYDRLVFS